MQENASSEEIMKIEGWEICDMGNYVRARLDTGWCYVDIGTKKNCIEVGIDEFFASIPTAVMAEMLRRAGWTVEPPQEVEQ